MFPQIPATEKSEGWGGLSSHKGSSPVGVQQVDAGIHREMAADGRPETLGKIAPEEDVACCLDRGPADGAERRSPLQDGFVQQRRAGLQPIPGQQPVWVGAMSLDQGYL
jgi:hypothetical protein